MNDTHAFYTFKSWFLKEHRTEFGHSILESGLFDSYVEQYLAKFKDTYKQIENAGLNVYTYQDIYVRFGPKCIDYYKSMLPGANCKVGLYFGSFNPLHNGHLMVAEQALERMNLDVVWMIVSPQNPLKPPGSLANEGDRLAMVREACLENPKFIACDVEFRLPKPSYTLTTLNYIAKKYPGNEYTFIAGHDLVAQMAIWEGGEEVLKRHPFFVHARPGAEDIYAKPRQMVYFDDVQFSVSSTSIRNLIKAGRSVRYLVPDNVIKYIKGHDLYL